jgi:hypothetical protein
MFVNLLKEKSKTDLRLEIEASFKQNSKPFPDTWSWSFDEKGKVYFIESRSNRKRYGKLVHCECCEREICVRANSEHKTCSKKCFALLSQKDKVKLNCANCSKEVFKAQKNLSNSKSGLYFCDRKCKEDAQKIGGIEAIQPDHYGDGSSQYSQKAFNFYGEKCCDCGLSFKPLLEVHHIDGDRANADIDNLEVVCKNHHLLRHLRLVSDSNEWVLDFRKLTPREKLKILIAERLVIK